MDFSTTVISKMQAKTVQIYGIESPAVAAIRWSVQDALNMENVREGSWDAVIDKSTSDCIACMDADGKLLERLSKQVHRVYSSMRNEDIGVKGNNGQALWDIKRVEIETESLTETVDGSGVVAAAPTIYHYVYICTKR
ncbi:hypothetical protein DL89DRAFT_269246 [Linderina pennispora]|uniref:Uncharacterized protein n=1 Tax=Linderina pennispora TaxID=61395 RepID=A0A1Y1W1S0_9FUNG|nr:uncharacterized protein DL89DRAFT_269246 [Linderina pennispora]ORX67427.1 hypothetical protein DL89DRAFT_269246 [Linderina pennispora]